MKKYLSLFLLLAFPAFAQDVPLKIGNCHQVISSDPVIPARQIWQQTTFQNYIELCPIKMNEQSPVVLSVLIIRIDKMYQDGRFEHREIIDIPNPLLLNTNSNRIGELPEGFPEDPPGKLGVTFNNWKNGFPTEIKLFELGQSAIDPGPLPSLYWSESQHKFILDIP